MDANYLALQKTIAASVLPAGSVRVSDVFISSVLPALAAQNKQVNDGEWMDMQSSPLPSLVVAYTVLSYRAGSSNTDLTSALRQAVDTGTFDNKLQQFAADEGATALLLTTSESLEVNSLNGVVDEGGGGGGGGDEGDGDGGGGDGDGPVVTSTGESSSSQGLAGAALLGVILGGAAVMLLLCAGLFYCVFCKASEDKGISLATPVRPHSVTAVSYGGVMDDTEHCAQAETVPSAPLAVVEMVEAAPTVDGHLSV